MGKASTGADLPEFHIVVRRPSHRGPLAPYRFAISVVVAFLVTFGDLQAALFEGTGGDDVLLRAIGAAVFTWIVLSVLNRVLIVPPEIPTGSDEPDRAP